MQPSTYTWTPTRSFFRLPYLHVCMACNLIDFRILEGPLLMYIMLWALGPVRLLVQYTLFVPHTYASYIKTLMYILWLRKDNTIIPYF